MKPHYSNLTGKNVDYIDWLGSCFYPGPSIKACGRQPKCLWLG